MISFTNDVSCEVVMPVERVTLLSAVLVHNHSSEILSEQLVVGPQVQSELPTQTNTQDEFRAPHISWTKRD